MPTEPPRLHTEQQRSTPSLIDKLTHLCLTQRMVVLLFAILLVAGGLLVAPFNWKPFGLPNKPIGVDAIPNTGENQQIVFTQWPGQSPQTIDDQVTYPLSVALLSVPNVKAVRSYSYFGFSSIYVILENSADFYDSRTRILEKLASLPQDTLPTGVTAQLGPDATAMGQVFWYTLEGRDESGQPASGWDLGELRTIQDWIVRYALADTPGVAEVSSIGGFVQEFQIDIDPDLLRGQGVTLQQVVNAVRGANLDMGARSLEMNQVEYLVRGVGQINNIRDIEQAVVAQQGFTPITVADVAHVQMGPAMRRGGLDKDGTEAVGGVVVARYGANPMQVLNQLQHRIDEVAAGLPEKLTIDWSIVEPQQVALFANRRGLPFDAENPASLFQPDNQTEWLNWWKRTVAADHPSWANLSKVTLVPFYDRSGLIQETLGTLKSALVQQLLITVLVVLLLVFNLRASAIISSLLPLAVLFSFVMMKTFGVEANIVALAGIAIAIGTVVDIGIVLCDAVMQHLKEADETTPRIQVVHNAVSEVGGAVLTAVATTVIGFLPIFFMTGAEGKLFGPLAYTKTFALIGSIVIALTVLPPLIHLLLAPKSFSQRLQQLNWAGLALLLIALALISWWREWSLATQWGETIYLAPWIAILSLIPLLQLAVRLMRGRLRSISTRSVNIFISLIVATAVCAILTRVWLPLGPAMGFSRNFILIATTVVSLLAFFWIFQHAYPILLRICLRYKIIFLCIPTMLIALGIMVWLGSSTITKHLPKSSIAKSLDDAFPGLQKEFMPALDEGSFLYMPTVMPHASIGESMDACRDLDASIRSIPEVTAVIGKVGRAESPLDPAPISMFENIIYYVPEYGIDAEGKRVRLWRDKIKSREDLWAEIQDAAKRTGVTGAPMLQPIETRRIMLQTGMTANIGIKVLGPSLDTIQKVGLQIESILRKTEGVDSISVRADRVVGKPYLEIHYDRVALSRLGLSIQNIQTQLMQSIGGVEVGQAVLGRERIAIRVRYAKEERLSPDAIGDMMVSLPSMPKSSAGITQIPLSDVAEVRFVPGPMVIKSESGQLVSYVTFGPMRGLTSVDVVQNVQTALANAQANGHLQIPAGVRLIYAGEYENQIRAQKTLAIVLPLALMLILMVLYLQFKQPQKERETMLENWLARSEQSISPLRWLGRTAIMLASLVRWATLPFIWLLRELHMALLVFIGIAVAWSGGFLLIWLYGQSWFLDIEIFSTNLRAIFQVSEIHLSVAVWVGFLALFGIATDDGVIMATYMKQIFTKNQPSTREDIHAAIIQAGRRRIRACLMTTATTVLALLPILTSSGRGADLMRPMAIPCVGGMLIELLTMFVVPVLYCMIQEWRLVAKKTTATISDKPSVRPPD